MTWSALFIFIGVYTVFVLSPGPTVAAIMARALSVGTMRTVPFILGIVSGDIVWFSLTAFGLAALTTSFSSLFVIIKYAGVAYLLYLAYKSWTSPTQISHQPLARGEGIKLYFGGLALCLGNPKAIIFFVSILPNVLDIKALTLGSFLQMSAIIIVIVTSCLIFYAALASHARKFVQSPSAMRMVNRATGTIMAGAAALIAARS